MAICMVPASLRTVHVPRIEMMSVRTTRMTMVFLETSESLEPVSGLVGAVVMVSFEPDEELSSG